MDKIKRYEAIILAFLNDYAKTELANAKNVETQIISDTQQHHYQLMRIGWLKNEFIHHCVFHFDIKNEKIWIQQNNTELQVADELVQLGVSASDIVLGFQPESVRALSGFAVA